MVDAAAFATMTCRRGRSASAPCSDLRDLPAALATLAGWGWDERGFVQCPECRNAPATAEAPQQAPPQGELLL